MFIFRVFACSQDNQSVRNSYAFVPTFVQSPVAVCDNICVNSRDFAFIQPVSRPSAANLYKLRGFHGYSVNGHSRPHLCISRGTKSIVVTRKQFRKWINVTFLTTRGASRELTTAQEAEFLHDLYHSRYFITRGTFSTALGAVFTNFRQL